MNKQEVEQFVMRDGKDILRFCRMNAGDTERGNELYQDTMLMLLEKRNQLNAEQNVKSYALYTAILLWKNKKKKYAVRNRILPMSSLEEHVKQGGQFRSGEVEKSPEQQVLNQAEIEEIQSVVAATYHCWKCNRRSLYDAYKPNGARRSYRRGKPVCNLCTGSGADQRQSGLY